VSNSGPIKDWLAIMRGEGDPDAYKLKAEDIDRSDSSGELLYQAMVEIAEKKGIPLKDLRIWPRNIEPDGQTLDGDTVKMQITFNYERWSDDS